MHSCCCACGLVCLRVRTQLRPRGVLHPGSSHTSRASRYDPRALLLALLFVGAGFERVELDPQILEPG